MEICKGSRSKRKRFINVKLLKRTNLLSLPFLHFLCLFFFILWFSVFSFIGDSVGAVRKDYPPVVVMVDGICLKAEHSLILNKMCWTDYLKEALSPQLSGYLIAPFQWTGDTRDTPSTLEYAKKFIEGYYKVAQQRGTSFEIIAHSWGSVLAYIVLKQNPDINVDTLITLGSPLRSNLLGIRSYTEKFTGTDIEKLSNVKKWANYWAWNDLISGPVGAADKNFQIDENIAKTDTQTRAVATKRFHSMYYIDWKNALIADLSSKGTSNNGQSETTIQPQTSDMSIQSVDFLNFSYYPNLCYQDYAKDGIQKVVQLHNGEFKNNEVFYSVVDNKIFYGDLTGDGSEEAVVHIACGLFIANSWGSEIFIYTLKNGKAVLLASLNDNDMNRDYYRHYPSGFLWRITDSGLKIIDGNLIVERYADGPHCCPEYVVTLLYRWNGKQLVLDKQPRKKIFKHW